MYYPARRILWRDIASDGGWMSTAEAEAWAAKQYTVLFETLGFVLTENPDYLLIASSLDPSDPEEPQWNDLNIIPRGAVARIELLTPETDVAH